MSDVFGKLYADAYDHFYHDKDYASECDLLEKIFAAYGKGRIHRILDLGCGTGNHAIPLAQRGYAVMGIDCSAEMLAQAQRKIDALPSGISLCFKQQDLQTLQLEEHFDIALMMFAVLGYQLKNSQVLQALKTARNHLRPDGLLIFDIWYGPAVLAQKPEQRAKVIPIEDGELIRLTAGVLDTRQHVCHVDYRIWQIQRQRLVSTGAERHTMRYFFPRELEFYLESAGFEPLRLGAFPDFDKDPDEDTWNALQVARAVG
ncbi:MAG: class I SAM-dependent methyltransferase [Anaerolineae bacterium]|nr:class I SAM-dependent methyltransferase [Anaerolineae bacterium]